MGVVINDFDVSAEGPQETTCAEPQPAGTQPGTAGAQQDPRDIFLSLLDRWERVKAD